VPSEIIRLVLRHFGRCAKRIRNERIKTEPISDVSKAPISGSKYLDRRFGKFPVRTKKLPASEILETVLQLAGRQLFLKNARARARATAGLDGEG